MFSKTLLLTTTTVAALLALARADPTPSAPGPGDVFNQGADCKIEWSPDTTGTWTQMSIELMTGANLDMKHLTTVTTLDATKTTTYTWPCPAVTPNSAIYFYQFTSPAPNTTTLWTTRFGIASTDGHLDPPSEQTQPGSNQAIPWGNGALVDPSEAKPPPAGASSANGSGSAAVSGSAGPGGASVSASASSAAPSGFTTSASTPVVVTQSPSASVSAKSSGSAAGGASKPASSSAVPSSGAAAANGAVGNSVRGGVSGVVVALVGVVAGVVVAF